MKAYTYIEKGKFALIDKPKPELQEATDAIVRVTLGSICSSDLHIKHGSVPRAVPGITVGHEMVGVVEAVGADVKGVKVGDRVTSTWKPSAVSASTAGTAMSTTAHLLMADGLSVVVSTADRRNMCVCRWRRRA